MEEAPGMVQTERRVVLEGRGVQLEPLADSHLDALAAIGLDPDIWEYWPYHATSRADMATFIRTALEEEARGVSIPFATVERASGTVVGTTRFMNLERAHRRVEIGSTWLGAPWRRTAVNTEAKVLMLRYAFDVLQMNRVELKTDVRNLRSRAAIARIGGREEGILRHHMLLWDGRLRDTVYYSILREEWPQAEANLHAKLRGQA
jgi:N-acetyltransferase